MDADKVVRELAKQIRGRIYRRGLGKDDWDILIERELAPVRALVEALAAYRASHNTCIEVMAQGRCNKCQMADAALAQLEAAGRGE